MSSRTISSNGRNKLAYSDGNNDNNLVTVENIDYLKVKTTLPLHEHRDVCSILT